MCNVENTQKMIDLGQTQWCIFAKPNLKFIHTKVMPQLTIYNGNRSATLFHC